MNKKELIDLIEENNEKIKRFWLSDNRQGYLIAAEKANELGKKLKELIK